MPPVIIRYRRIARRNDEATRLPAEGMVSERSRPAFEAGSPQTAVRRTRTTRGKRDPEARLMGWERGQARPLERGLVPLVIMHADDYVD